MNYRELLAINKQVNENVAYRSDPKLYKKPEFWTPALTAGDCEDYALKKREILLGCGVNPDSLSIATCWTETGGYHAVLIVSLPDNDYVLDNRHQTPMLKSNLEYRWDKIQRGNTWYDIS